LAVSHEQLATAARSVAEVQARAERLETRVRSLTSDIPRHLRRVVGHSLARVDILTKATQVDDTKAAVFEEHRRLLFSIAYRMLGTVADAEAAVQDAFVRWQRASEIDVRSPKAFLVTIVSRLCINQLQSARVQRETYVGEWLPEPIITDSGSDPVRVREVNESVSMAMLLLLERLTPVERAVFC